MTEKRFRMDARAARCSGQAMVEYLIVASLVAAVLLIPFAGQPPLIVQFLNAIGTGFSRFFSAMSLPL